MSCTGAWMFAPACVSRPSLIPARARSRWEGVLQQVFGVMPSIVLTQGFCVRKPNGPTVPCACCGEGAKMLPYPPRSCGLRRDLQGEAEPRRHVVRCPSCTGSADAVHAHEHQAARQVRVARDRSGQRRPRRRVEVVHAVVSLGPRRVEVVTQAEVQRRARADPPVVLGVAGPVKAVGGDVLPALDQDSLAARCPAAGRRSSCPPCCWPCSGSGPASRPPGS